MLAFPAKKAYNNGSRTNPPLKSANLRQNGMWKGISRMKAYDIVKKEELEVTTEDLIELMRNNRQVDCVLQAPKTDEDGYLTWDTEYWTTVDSKRFIRTYSLKGRTLRDSTSHNIYDLANDFHPEEAKEIRIS